MLFKAVFGVRSIRDFAKIPTTIVVHDNEQVGTDAACLDVMATTQTARTVGCKSIIQPSGPNHRTFLIF